MGRLTITAGCTTLATTTRALMLDEAGHLPVHYVPRADVAMALSQKTDVKTTCPYKGVASYYSIQTDQGLLENAAWCHEVPISGMEAITGHIAFYSDTVSLTPA